MNKESTQQFSFQHIPTQRTGRVANLGSGNKQTKRVWIVLHGYRQLATNFVRKFHPWADDKTWVVAPEALSRFYVEGFTGLVGASWMTREDRLTEIEDQIVWLDNIWDWVSETVDPETCEINVLGLSQGVATLWRWLQRSEKKPTNIVFYAGKIPEEFTEKMDEQLSHSRIVFAYGSQDQFLTEERVQGELNIFAAHMSHATPITFEGKHDIYPEALTKIRKSIRW